MSLTKEQKMAKSLFEIGLSNIKDLERAKEEHKNTNSNLYKLWQILTNLNKFWCMLATFGKFLCSWAIFS